LLASLIAGCGFRLQGALTTPAEMEKTFIEPADEYSQFYRELRQALQSSGVEVVESADEATAVLTILADETDQRVLSVSARNEPTEYEVYYTVAYSIVSGEKVLLSPQDITLTNDYTYDTRLVLGKAHEETMLRDALVSDLVRVVLKQISTL
jgi:LPS-assembly lipoprotein